MIIGSGVGVDESFAWQPTTFGLAWVLLPSLPMCSESCGNPAFLVRIKTRMPWVDDPERGVGSKTLERVEDVSGAEGMIGGKLVRFEKILEVGENQVVYGLHCPSMDCRLAYGFA